MNYTTHGVCSRAISFEVKDNKVTNVHFVGGCSGNTQNPVNVICDKLNHKAASYHSKRCFCQKLYKNGGSGRSDSSK